MNWEILRYAYVAAMILPIVAMLDLLATASRYALLGRRCKSPIRELSNAVLLMSCLMIPANMKAAAPDASAFGNISGGLMTLVALMFAFQAWRAQRTELLVLREPPAPG